MRAVFVPGGLPKHTYVPRSNLRLEEQLRAATDNLCKLVTVTGPTKSGKSVLTQVGGFGLASHDPPQFLVVPRAIKIAAQLAWRGDIMLVEVACRFLK
jgi:hypothetical protein